MSNILKYKSDNYLNNYGVVKNKIELIVLVGQLNNEKIIQPKKKIIRYKNFFDTHKKKSNIFEEISNGISSIENIKSMSFWIKNIFQQNNYDIITIKTSSTMFQLVKKDDIYILVKDANKPPISIKINVDEWSLLYMDFIEKNIMLNNQLIFNSDNINSAKPKNIKCIFHNDKESSIISMLDEIIFYNNSLYGDEQTIIHNYFLNMIQVKKLITNEIIDLNENIIKDIGNLIDSFEMYDSLKSSESSKSSEPSEPSEPFDPLNLSNSVDSSNFVDSSNYVDSLNRLDKYDMKIGTKEDYSKLFEQVKQTIEDESKNANIEILSNVNFLSEYSANIKKCTEIIIKMLNQKIKFKFDDKKYLKIILDSLEIIVQSYESINKFLNSLRNYEYFDFVDVNKELVEISCKINNLYNIEYEQTYTCIENCKYKIGTKFNFLWKFEESLLYFNYGLLVENLIIDDQIYLISHLDKTILIEKSLYLKNV